MRVILRKRHRAKTQLTLKKTVVGHATKTWRGTGNEFKRTEKDADTVHNW